MDTPRKDPVFETTPSLLEKRVKLTWREVKNLAETGAPEAPAVPVEPVVGIELPAAASKAPAEAALHAGAEPRRITLASLAPEDRDALVAALSPAIEAYVRDAVTSTIEASLSNAVVRTRRDVESSLSIIAAESVRKAIDQLDLSAYLKS